MRMRLAFFTFGVLRASFDDPSVEGFVERVPGIFGSVEGAGGFIDRARIGADGQLTEVGRWGEWEVPSFAQSTPDRAAQTLSVWEDIESVYVFGYQGVHSEALRRASEWVEEGACPSHVAWWIEDDV